VTEPELVPIPGTAPGTFMGSCSACHKSDETDDHPKVHYGADKYHFDCLPPRVVEDILGNIDPVEQKRFEALVRAATTDGRGHLHGHDLRVKAIHLRHQHPREDEPPITHHERAFLTHVGASLPKGVKSNG
jgi:hypothetical protein